MINHSINWSYMLISGRPYTVDPPISSSYRVSTTWLSCTMERLCTDGFYKADHEDPGCQSDEDSRPGPADPCMLCTAPKWYCPCSSVLGVISDPCPTCKQRSYSPATPGCQGCHSHKTYALPSVGIVCHHLCDKGKACSGGTGHADSGPLAEPGAQPYSWMYSFVRWVLWMDRHILAVIWLHALSEATGLLWTHTQDRWQRRCHLCVSGGSHCASGTLYSQWWHHAYQQGSVGCEWQNVVCWAHCLTLVWCLGLC